MSRRGKLLRRFLAGPPDFTFDEMTTLLKGFGYERTGGGRTSGSRTAFIDRASGHIIRLHRPHPANRLRKYQLDLVEEALRARGLIR